MVRNTKQCFHRGQHFGLHRNLRFVDRRIGEPQLPRTGHCARFADFTVFRDARRERGALDQYDLGSGLGSQWPAVAGINDLVVGLREFPVIGQFFSMWPELKPISFRASQTSAYAVIMMVTWQWTPFAVLIFMTSLQSEDESQKEAAMLDGASAWSQFINLTVPHLARPIAIVVMIQSIFHLSLYAEIEIVSRGNGNKNLPYLIGEFTSNNIGAASATGIFAVILANIIAIFLLRMVGKSLMD